MIGVLKSQDMKAQDMTLQCVEKSRLKWCFLLDNSTTSGCYLDPKNKCKAILGMPSNPNEIVL